MKKRNHGLLIIAIPVNAQLAPKSMRAITGKSMKKSSKRVKAR